MSLEKTKVAAKKLVDSYVTSMFNMGATFSFATTDISYTDNGDQMMPTTEEVVAYMKDIFNTKVTKIPEHAKKAQFEKKGIVVTDPINIANAMEKIFIGVFSHSDKYVVVGFTHVDAFDVNDLCKRVCDKAGCSGDVYYSDKEGNDGRKHIMTFIPPVGTSNSNSGDDPEQMPPFKFRDRVQTGFFEVFKDLNLYVEEESDDEAQNYGFEF